MLTYQLLKNHAGVMLCGDHQSLESFHTVLHQINDKSVLIKDKEGIFLSLAYDVRKAYEGQRKVFKPSKNEAEHGTSYGVQVLWPALLVQSRILRESLAFIDSTKWQQAFAYNIEALIESGLEADFGADSQIIKDKWEHLGVRHPHAEEVVESRCAIFSSWSKTERKKRLAGLLFSLDPMYSSVYELWMRRGDTSLVHPNELESWKGKEWPDPKW